MFCILKVQQRGEYELNYHMVLTQIAFSVDNDWKTNLEILCMKKETYLLWLNIKQQEDNELCRTSSLSHTHTYTHCLVINMIISWSGIKRNNDIWNRKYTETDKM